MAMHPSVGMIGGVGTGTKRSGSVGESAESRRKGMRLEGYGTEGGLYPHSKPDVKIFHLKEAQPTGDINHNNLAFNIKVATDEIVRQVLFFIIFLYCLYLYINFSCKIETEPEEGGKKCLFLVSLKSIKIVIFPI